MLRLKRSLSEKIYLLSATQVSNTHWKFNVRGQSKKIYEQNLQPELFSCSCPDHTTKHTFCKHLLFLVARVAIQMELAGTISENKSNWNNNAFNTCALSWISRLKNHINKEKKTDVDIDAIGNDCPICFEVMKEGESLVKCVTTCKKFFHKDCMSLWLSSDHDTCPLCRADWVEATEEPDELVVNILPTPTVSDIHKTDIVFSFDTTGSMYSCLSEVKRSIGGIVDKLFDEIPELRLAIISHGDYCDGDKTILTLDFTTDRNAIKQFVQDAPSTSGGDYPECYELVLHNTKDLSWRHDATLKSLIMIGDAIPHDKNATPLKIDWREEAEKLANRNIQIFSVQCLNNGKKEPFEFYSTIAKMTNGYHLFLDQFSYIKDMIQAICYKQYNVEHLQEFETQLQTRENGMNNALRLMFDTMLGRKTREEVENEMRPERFLSRYRSTPVRTHGSTSATPSLASESDLRPCVPTRFQVFTVTEDSGIKDFCRTVGITFQTGNGYYEFTKPEIIQPNKEIVLMDRATGDLFEGDVARRIAGIGRNDEKARIKPGSLPKYRVFIQSTSATRKLISGQGFLYDMS